MKNTKPINVTIDTNTLTVITALSERVGIKVSHAFTLAARLLLREIGYSNEAVNDPQKVLSMCTKLKSLVDGTTYTQDEILAMIKSGNFTTRTTQTTDAIKRQFDRLQDKAQDLNAQEAAVHDTIKAKLSEGSPE